MSVYDINPDYLLLVCHLYYYAILDMYDYWWQPSDSLPYRQRAEDDT